MSLQALTAFSVALLSVAAAFGEQSKDKDADLRTQIQQLEKRVAELEKQIKELRASAKEAPRTEAETKLVGVWLIADADKKDALFSDMKLNGDGTYALVGMLNTDNGTYRVIGKQIEFTIPAGKSASYGASGRLVSVTDKELVIERKKGDEVQTMHFTRAK
jgi:hypothetical protein